MNSSNQAPPNTQGNFQKNLHELGDDCQKKLDSLSGNLTKSKTQIDELLKEKPVDNLKPTLDTLNQSKQEALDALNKYFTELEKQVRAKDTDKLPKQEVDKRAQKVLEKIAARQQVLNGLSKDLGTKEKTLDAMKAVGDSNFETENQNIQKEIDECQRLLRGDAVKLTKDAQALPGLNKALEQFIRIDDPKNPNPSNVQANKQATNLPQQPQQPPVGTNNPIQGVPTQNTGQGSQKPQDKFKQKDIEGEWERGSRRQERRKEPNSFFTLSDIRKRV